MRISVANIVVGPPKRMGINRIASIIITVYPNYVFDRSYYELYKLITGEEGIEKMPKDDIMEWVKIYIDKIPNWEKPSDIIKSNRNAALGLFYNIRKEKGEKIQKKDFLINTMSRKNILTRSYNF